MPRPKPSETEDSFISRYMGSAHAIEKYPDEKQRLAVAYSVYKRRNKKKKALEYTQKGYEICCRDGVCYKLYDEIEALDSEPSEVKLDQSRMTATGIFCTRDRDRMGDVMEPAGIVTSSHRENPVVLLDHGLAYPIPLGLTRDSGTGDYTVEIDSDTGRAVQTTFFAKTKVAEQIYHLIVEGVISGNSIGFRPLQWSRLAPDPALGETKSNKHIHSCELVELSWVAVPANKNCILPFTEDSARIEGKKLAPCIKRMFMQYAEPRNAWSPGFNPATDFVEKKDISTPMSAVDETLGGSLVQDPGAKPYKETKCSCTDPGDCQCHKAKSITTKCGCKDQNNCSCHDKPNSTNIKTKRPMKMDIAKKTSGVGRAIGENVGHHVGGFAGDAAEAYIVRDSLKPQTKNTGTGRAVGEFVGGHVGEAAEHLIASRFGKSNQKGVLGAAAGVGGSLAEHAGNIATSGNTGTGRAIGTRVGGNIGDAVEDHVTSNLTGKKLQNAGSKNMAMVKRKGAAGSIAGGLTGALAGTAIGGPLGGAAGSVIGSAVGDKATGKAMNTKKKALNTSERVRDGVDEGTEKPEFGAKSAKGGDPKPGTIAKFKGTEKPFTKKKGHDSDKGSPKFQGTQKPEFGMKSEESEDMEELKDMSQAEGGEQETEAETNEEMGENVPGNPEEDHPDFVERSDPDEEVKDDLENWEEDIDQNKEPLSAETLRDLHADLQKVHKVYSEATLMVEHPEIKPYLQKFLDGMMQEVENIEQIFSKAHPDQAELERMEMAQQDMDMAEADETEAATDDMAAEDDLEGAEAEMPEKEPGEEPPPEALDEAEVDTDEIEEPEDVPPAKKSYSTKGLTRSELAALEEIRDLVDELSQQDFSDRRSKLSLKHATATLKGMCGKAKAKVPHVKLSKAGVEVKSEKKDMDMSSDMEMKKGAQDDAPSLEMKSYLDKLEREVERRERLLGLVSA